MPLAQSKVTAQGQISVPAEIRKRLGAGPGSILEWDEDGDQIVVRKAGRHTSSSVHAALFGKVPPKQSTAPSVKKGIKKYTREKHARR
jgi:antitoxin PrlF